MSDRALDLLFLAFALAGGLLACLTYTGCSTYTVVPADREVVPVKQVQDSPRTYVETVDGATGWYIPDATLLDLLEAD